MAETEKRADRCISAVFGDDGTGTFGLLSCAAWLSISKIDHSALEISRTATGVWHDKGRSEDDMVDEIGRKCTNLCATCPRFSPRFIPVDTIDVGRFLSSAGA